MKQLKGVAWIIGVGFAVTIIGAIVSTSCGLMNQKSDMSFFSGMLILMILAAGLWVAVSLFFESRKKKNIPPIAVVALLLLPVFSGCWRTVEPGYVGIKVNMSGDDRGVDQLPLETGRVFYNPFTQTVFQYPTFVHTAVWTKDLNEGHAVNEEITFTTQDQMVVAADISIAYKLKQKKVPWFYVMFRNDELEVFTHGFMRNLAREKFDGCAGRYKIEQIMGDNLPFLTEVRGQLQKALDTIGVEIEQFGLVGAPRPPTTVIEAINAKVGATQNAIKAENEVRMAEAEAKKRIAEATGEARARVALAEGEAQANKALASSLSDALLKWRGLAIQEQAIAKWNGARPQVEGTGSGLMLQLPIQH